MAETGDFQDSASLAAYYSARFAEVEERYEDAQTEYEKIPYFLDSAERKRVLPDLIVQRDERNRTMKYTKAQGYLSSGEYAAAIAIFEELGNYEDATKYGMDAFL